jgi:hypothetical protein
MQYEVVVIEIGLYRGFTLQHADALFEPTA